MACLCDDQGLQEHHMMAASYNDKDIKRFSGRIVVDSPVQYSLMLYSFLFLS